MQRIGKRNVVMGNYSMREARTSVHDAESAEWRVYFKQALEPMSAHPSRAAAVQAAKRYIEADRRRARAREQQAACR